MLNNHLYNLILQLTQENKTLWRIKNKYMDDADCGECKELWKKMETDKEKNVEELTELIKKHL